MFWAGRAVCTALGRRGGVMRRLVAMAGLLVALATTAAAEAIEPPPSDHTQIEITARQAHDLSVRELARLVLGAVGDLAVDVDRPEADTASSGAAALDQLTFYVDPSFSQEPFSPFALPPPPPAEGTSGDWSVDGVCSLAVIEVAFSSASHEGASVVSGLEAETRFALAQKRFRNGSLQPACREPGADYRAYFPAPNVDAAWDIGRFVGAIAQAARTKQRLPFAVACRPAPACANRRRALSALKVADITSAAEVRCTARAARSACYELRLGDAAGALSGTRYVGWKLTVAGVGGEAPKVLSVGLQPRVAPPVY
jgi:hypothetical protein